MLSVGVHKDLTKYQVKIAGGLTMRTLLCIVGAIGTSIAFACYFWFVWSIPFDNICYLAYAVGLPLWAAAFWQPLHMPPEQWLPLYLRHNFGCTHLIYETKQRYSCLIENEKDQNYAISSRSYEKFARKQRGIELWEPGITSEEMPILRSRNDIQ